MAINTKGFSGTSPAAAWRSKKSCGVVFCGQHVIAVRSWRAGLRTVRHAAIDMADRKARRMVLAEAARRNVEIVGCLGTAESLTMLVTAPFPSLKKAEKVFPSLLDIQLPFPLEECLYVLLDSRRAPDNKTRALAVAARREAIAARLKKYRDEDIDPVRLDHEGLALWTQSLLEIPPAAEASRAVIYLDRDHATLVIGTSSEFINAHSTGIFNAAASAGAASADTETTDRLPEWIRRILLAEPQAGKPMLWVFCGPGAADSTLVNRVYQELNRDWPGPCATHNEPATFLARAISRRALIPGPLNCNLRIGELTHPSVLARARKHTSRTAALILISGLLFCVFSLAWQIASRSRIAQVQRAINTLACELAPGARIQYGMEMDTVRKALDQQSEFMTPFLNAFQPSLLIRVAAIIDAGHAANVTFQKLVLKSNRVEISGATDDWNRCEKLAESLKGMGFTVKLVRDESGGDLPIHFTLKGEIASR